MFRFACLVLLLTGCASSPPESTSATTAMPAATAISMPSELVPDAAIRVVRNTLRRSGWPVAEAPDARVTDWRETDAGPVRLYATATDRGASTTVAMWAEVQRDGAAVPVVHSDRPDGAWAVAVKAMQRVRDDVRYARF